MIDFPQINNAALARCPAILEQILPGGRVNGGEYLCADVNGGEGRSFSVNLQSGLWKDFSGDSKGGRDIVSLVAEQRNLKQGEAARELAQLVGICTETGPTSSRTAGRVKGSTLAPVMPIPASAPAWPRECGNLGIMATSFEYRDAQGRLLGIVGRWNRPDGKQIRPLVFTSSGWKFQDFSKPYPIYGLERLASAPPDRPVLLTEGEGKALDAQKLLGDSHVVLSVYGGASRVRYNDFAPLKGRTVIYWPDNDEAGLKAAQDAVTGLRKAGVESVFVVTPPDGAPQKWDLSNAVREGWTADRVRGLIEAAMKEGGGGGVLIYRPGELPRAVQDIENSLEGQIYQSGGVLVRIVSLPEKRSYGGITRQAGTVIVAPLDTDTALYLASKAANWARINHKQEEKPCNPPREAVTAWLAAVGNWNVPILTGITNCPVLRADGSILDREGYDFASGLFADFGGQTFKPVSENPGREEARNALNLLLDAVNEFSFCANIDRSVALAALLTALMRRSVMAAPMFGLTAPTPGTGKSTLADLISIVATGQSAPAIDYVQDEAEFKKTLFAFLLEGSPVALLDNVVGDLNSTLLNIALTQEKVKGRILGLSKNAVANPTCVWLTTGNNLTISGDLTRRTLLCSLDTGMEKPAERPFKRNLYEWAAKHRADLVHAGLTVLRAHQCAGKPASHGLKPMNGFNQWSAIVRGALVWLDMPDPLDTQKDLEAADPEREALGTVLTAWWNCLGDSPVVASDLLRTDESRVGLYQALVSAVNARSGLNSKSLGKWLARYQGRIVNGYRIINKGSWSDRKLWAVQKAA